MIHIDCVAKWSVNVLQRVRNNKILILTCAFGRYIGGIQKGSFCIIIFFGISKVKIKKNIFSLQDYDRI